MKYNFAVIIPMANESIDFQPFVFSLTELLNLMECGSIYFIIDKVSNDNTLELCKNLSLKDDRFTTIWAPENKNVVDAYMRGYKEALKKNHKFIIEMENIAVTIADNLIEKELLKEIITSIINDEDYSEELKLKIINALSQVKPETEPLNIGVEFYKDLF